MPGTNADVGKLGGFVWSIAEILRGDFKQSEYGKVILPFIVLRRLDCLLDASKRDVLEAARGLSDEPRPPQSTSGAAKLSCWNGKGSNERPSSTGACNTATSLPKIINQVSQSLRCSSGHLSQII